MKTLNSLMRSMAMASLFSGAALVAGQAHATYTLPEHHPHHAPAPATGGGVTTPLTSPLSVVGGQDTDLTKRPVGFNPNWYGDASTYTNLFDFSDMSRGGTLLLTEAVAQVTFTLVGFESWLNNAFVVDGERLDNRDSCLSNLGDSISFSNVAAGELNFSFLTHGLGRAKGNGSNATGVLLSEDHNSALIVFNDGFGRRDYDDMVILMTISPVPEPEAAAMLLAGLGLVGAATRRRQQRKA